MACIIGIISGPDQETCKLVVRQMWLDHLKEEFRLTLDYKENAEKFRRLYLTAQIKFHKKKGEYKSLKDINKILPTRLSWLSVSYADPLQYVAHVYSSHPQRERDIKAYEVHDITAQSVSRPRNAVVFNADGKIIQFDIPQAEKPPAPREDEKAETWMCAIQ